MPAPDRPHILFQDSRFVVLDKPAGLPVHAGPRGGRSVEDWFPLLSRRRDGPWLAHRLDADTAGCLVIALRRAALHAAQAAFGGGSAQKTYWAVVDGGPAGESGRVDLPLSKRSDPAGWRMVADPSGPPCSTEWQVRGRAGGLSWLELRPRTGRTHQIRVHCAFLGCPVPRRTRSTATARSRSISWPARSSCRWNRRCRRSRRRRRICWRRCAPAASRP